MGQGAIVFGSFFARWRFELQASNMGKHFPRSGPATEIKAEQLRGPFGRDPTHPQTKEQPGKQRHVDLQLHPILTLAEQRATAQDTFKPAKEEFDVAVATHKTIDLVVPTQVKKLQRHRQG
jgi:hypothetical protein